MSRKPGLRVFTAVAALAAAAPQDAPHSLSQDPSHIFHLTGGSDDYVPLWPSLRDAQFVLLGEATHGTQEFYVERARISQRLIQDQGFRGVVIEADWSEVEPLNRYVRGLDNDPVGAFRGFETFPEWMWRNTAFRDFVEWLRRWNEIRPEAQRAGLYGMDVDQLFQSADAAVEVIRTAHPEIAQRIEAHYRCFTRYRDAAAYGRAARRAAGSCETQTRSAWREGVDLPPEETPLARENQFSALRHASTVVGSEAYHRAVHAGSYAWNVRDRAMADAVQEVAAHVGSKATQAGRVIVWAHNTHVGDARATSAALQGETNLGQILRERNAAVFAVGFLTSTGRVMAAEDWGGLGRVQMIMPPLAGSDAAVLRDAGLTRALLFLGGSTPLQALHERRLQRAIGVVYVPGQERTAHYIEAVLGDQFDAVVYMDTTTAVSALPEGGW